MIWDVVVIGGGPAGMMAAGRAAERGQSVLVLEKNPNVGKKLLITGGGRCNVTNNKTEIRTLLSKYTGSDQFLFSTFSQFSVSETLNFFNSRGMETKEENENRMFPISNKAQSVWNVLVEYMKKTNVTAQKDSEVTGIRVDKESKHILISVFENKNKKEITAKSCIVATGGTSRPETGSTGDGFVWLKKLGHTIIPNNAALVPIALKDEWVKKLGGVVLQNIKLTTFQDGEKQEAIKGKILFTHFGISGPTVLNMSKDVGELIKYGEVTIKLDLFPQFDPGALKKEIQNLLITESNKKIKNTLDNMVTPALVIPLLELANINPDTPNHSVKTEERARLILLLKNIPLHVEGLLGADKAVVSSGGVTLEEINFKTMQSKIIPNIYIVGDVLNVDRPSGGYSLQLCWTTGFVAGDCVNKII